MVKIKPTCRRSEEFKFETNEQKVLLLHEFLTERSDEACEREYLHMSLRSQTSLRLRSESPLTSEAHARSTQMFWFGTSALTAPPTRVSGAEFHPLTENTLQYSLYADACRVVNHSALEEPALTTSSITDLHGVRGGVICQYCRSCHGTIASMRAAVQSSGVRIILASVLAQGLPKSSHDL